jgi:hypothetical protein
VNEEVGEVSLLISIITHERWELERHFEKGFPKQLRRLLTERCIFKNLYYVWYIVKISDINFFKKLSAKHKNKKKENKNIKRHSLRPLKQNKQWALMSIQELPCCIDPSKFNINSWKR